VTLYVTVTLDDNSSSLSIENTESGTQSLSASDASLSLTASANFTETPVVPVYVPVPALDPELTTAVVTVLVTVTSVATVASASSPLGDAQTLVLIGMASCSSAATKASLSPSGALVAPLEVGDGPWARLLGNVVIVASVLLVHTLATLGYTFLRQRNLRNERAAAKAKAEKRDKKHSRRFGQRVLALTPGAANAHNGAGDAPASDVSPDAQSPLDESLLAPRTARSLADPSADRERLRQALEREDRNHRRKAHGRTALIDKPSTEDQDTEPDSDEELDYEREAEIARGKLKYPAFTFSVFNYFLPGTAFFGFREIATPPERTVAGTIVGCIAMLCIFGLWFVGARRVRKEMFDSIYLRLKMALRDFPMWARLHVLPRGVWLAGPYTSSFGPLFKSSKRHKFVYFFSVVTPARTIFISVVGAFNPEEAFGEGVCWIQFAMMIAVCLIYSIFVIATHPFRYPLLSPIAVLSNLSVILMCAAQLAPPEAEVALARAALLLSLGVALLATCATVAHPMLERFFWLPSEVQRRRKLKPVFGERKWAIERAVDEEKEEWGDSDEEAKRHEERAQRRIDKRKAEELRGQQERESNKALALAAARQRRHSAQQQNKSAGSARLRPKSHDGGSYDDEEESDDGDERHEIGRRSPRPGLRVSPVGAGALLQVPDRGFNTLSPTMAALLGHDSGPAPPVNPLVREGRDRSVTSRSSGRREPHARHHRRRHQRRDTSSEEPGNSSEDLSASRREYTTL
jgi:hypothetical protein